MRFRLLILLLLALSAFPGLAQNSTTHTVSFDGFSFSYESSLSSTLNIAEIAGDPTDLDQPGGPQVAHTQYTLYYNTPPAPENIFDTSATIRVYNTADFAGYEFFEQELQSLQTLLAERPDLTTFTASTETTQEASLPFVPVYPAAQVLRARANYVDTTSFSGISYLTLYRQDVSPFLAHEFVYTFQGLSNDGSTYVSAVFWTNTSLFPAEMADDFDYEEFSANYEQYVTESVNTLKSAASEDFAPSLASLDTMISSFAISGTGAPMPETPAAPLPEATEPADQIGTAGPLEGTWTLVSWGNPDSPQPVLPEAPVAITFAPEGISGNAGCNQFSGPFQFENDTVSFGELITTRMACAENIMAQETAFLTALQSAASFVIADSLLTINYDGGVLTFASADAPVPPTGETGNTPLGTWMLASYGSPDNPQTVQEPAPTITFAADGISGAGSCNQYSGSFSFEDNTVTFSNIISTLMACEEPIMAQETAFFDALQSATTLEVVDGQLRITYNGGVLVFNAA